MIRTSKNKSQKLQNQIIKLQNRQKNEFAILKIETQMAWLQLSPSSLLNRAVTDIKDNHNTGDTVIEMVLSFVGGYFSKKILVGKSNSLFKNLLGYVVQYASTKIISKNMK